MNKVNLRRIIFFLIFTLLLPRFTPFALDRDLVWSVFGDRLKNHEKYRAESLLFEHEDSFDEKNIVIGDSIGINHFGSKTGSSNIIFNIKEINPRSIGAILTNLPKTEELKIDIVVPAYVFSDLAMFSPHQRSVPQFTHWKLKSKPCNDLFCQKELKTFFSIFSGWLSAPVYKEIKAKRYTRDLVHLKFSESTSYGMSSVLSSLRKVDTKNVTWHVESPSPDIYDQEMLITPLTEFINKGFDKRYGHLTWLDPSKKLKEKYSH